MALSGQVKEILVAYGRDGIYTTEQASQAIMKAFEEEVSSSCCREALLRRIYE